MFDLQSALTAWRREMASHEAVGVEALAELESHLLDAFDALCAQGHDAEEAFDLAVRRLGSCDSLHAEFAKRDPRGLTRERAVWALLGIMTWVVLWEAWNLAFGRASLFLAAALPDGWRGGSWLYGEGVPSEGYAIALALVNLTVLVLVLHWLESSRAGEWLFRLRRAARHPVRFAVLVVAVLVVLRGVRWPLHYLLAQVYEPEVFGQAALVSMVASWVLVLVQPLIIGSFLLRWRNAIRFEEDGRSVGEERIARVPAPVFWMLLGAIGYSILVSVLHVIQRLLDVSWLVLRPDSWPVESWLYDARYRFSELEAVLLVLVPLLALGLLMRSLSPEWTRGRLHGELHLMPRRHRFWVVYLLLCWLPPLCSLGTRHLTGRWMSIEVLGHLNLLSFWTNELLSLALTVGIAVTFLLLVKRGRPGASGQVECTR